MRCGHVQNLELRKFFLACFHSFIRKFAPTEISRYTVYTCHIYNNVMLLYLIYSLSTELLLQIQSQGRKLPHILSHILPGASIPPTFNMTRFKLTVVGDLGKHIYMYCTLHIYIILRYPYFLEAVGKTSLVNRFTQCEFMESGKDKVILNLIYTCIKDTLHGRFSEVSTLAALPSERYPVITAEGENVLLEIWDTPGKEEQLMPL